jgi:disulfide bond formation protein DsbB
LGPSCSEQRLDILGGIQIPWLSLAVFSGIAFLLFVFLRKTRT